MLGVFFVMALIGPRLQVAALGLAALLPTAAASSEINSRTGIISEVQLVDATPLGEGAFLILSLEDGSSYLVPDQRQIAGSAGVKVAIRYLPPGQDDELGQACTVHVLGLPIVLDGEEVLHRAQRPFEIYSNDNPDCKVQSAQSD
ncbi:MAG: hypothetical protein ACNA7J_10885 [Wenzhouxiangella sp.]